MQESPCDKFTKREDGVWVGLKPCLVPGNSGPVRVGPGMEFVEGIQYMGVDIAAWLEKECGG